MYMPYHSSLLEQLPQETWNLIVYDFQGADLQNLESVSKKLHNIISAYRVVMVNYGKEISLIGVKNVCHFAIKNKLLLFKINLDQSILIDNNLLKEIGKIARLKQFILKNCKQITDVG